MSTQILKEKLELIQWVSSLEDHSIIKKLMDFRARESPDWWDELSDIEKAEIKEGLEQADRGEIISHDTVMKSFEKWK